MERHLRTWLLTTFTLILLAGKSPAQQIRWNNEPSKGFVFQITNKEAEKLLTNASPDTIFNGLLHTMVDTFDISQGWIDRPDKGHFVLARIVGNKLHCEYTSVFPYQVFLLKTYNALALQVLDLEGNVRDDAKVKFRFRRLRLDPESKTYRIENEWFTGDQRIVTVELEGFQSVFNITKHDVPSWNYSTPYSSGPSFYSYMVTDKHRYRPAEKIRFKSYALSSSRSPLRRNLELWLTGIKYVKLAEVAPHRPGSFSGEFQLHDSLKLLLDRNYGLELRERNGRVVSHCSFKYEDYELHGNKLHVELSHDSQFHPQSNQLQISATDVNGLVLKDAHAAILVSPSSVREIFQTVVVLPDTLMYKEINLDTEGPTAVDIPSSLFSKSNLAYDVKVVVTNSQNQRMEQKVSGFHYYSEYEVAPKFSNDTVVVELLKNGSPLNEVAVEVFHDGAVSGRKTTFPYREKINPVVSRMRFVTDSLSREINLADLMPELALHGGIARDSFNIRLDNPQQLDISWFVYQGSDLIQKGFGKELEYNSLITDRTQTYYVEMLYSFGGEDNIKRKAYEFREDRLDVTLDMPERVYPGQQVEATILVHDQLGNPMSNVDLTAWAVTAKMNHRIPDLSYFGSSSSPRSKAAHYTKDELNKRTAILDLDYKRWEKIARLDTMKYYQFTYPGSTVFRHVTSIDDNTQFACYVMDKGAAREVFVVEVNRTPVYYSWVDQPGQYSFYVTSERKQEVTLRLHDRVLIFDSLFFEHGKKTILSIDVNDLPEDVRIHKIAPVIQKTGRKRKKYYQFTTTELNRHKVYLAAFTPRDKNGYLETEKVFTPLYKSGSQARGPVIAGPIAPGMQTFTNHFTRPITYRHAGGYQYLFEDNIVYKSDAPPLFPSYLNSNTYDPMLTVNDVVMTKEKFLEEIIEPDRWHPSNLELLDPSTRVAVFLPEEKERSGVASLIFQNTQTKEVTSPCQNHYYSSKYYTIPRGSHHLILLYNNGTYLKVDSVQFSSWRYIVTDLRQTALHPPDSTSLKWLTLPLKYCYKQSPVPKTLALSRPKRSVGNIRGFIYDENNSPLLGANIIEKGTTNGTMVDIDGRFSLDITSRSAVIVVSFIGYVTKEIEVQTGVDLSISMEPDIQSLSEVVVVGYSQQTKSLLAASVALSGRVSGVVIGEPDREAASEKSEEGEKAITPDGEEELYRELLALNAIRSKFSEVGFWEPRLFTDKTGKANFTVTFPDDITRWDAVVYAMNRYLQTGTGRKSIRSYKPIMAELHVPQFLTRGDSAAFIGKVLNYTRGKNIDGKVKWERDSSSFEKDISFSDYHTDLLPVNVTTTDSISASYMFTRDDGYLDGEVRKVPVVEQGTERAEGSLSILKNNDEVHIKASAGKQVYIEILSNPLDIYAGEARYLVDYKYACNEQLASKLLGLISHKMVLAFKGEKFKYDKDINKIIARLLENQNEEFLWSWWDVSPNTSYWMSAHILRALKAARDAGYTVNLNVENIVRKATYKFDFLNAYRLSDIDLLHALAGWGAMLDYHVYLHKMDSVIRVMEEEQKTQRRRGYYRHYSYLKEKFLVQEIRQITNLPYQLDTLMKYRKDGILGEIYFSDGKQNRYWYTDDLTVNTIAYRILRRDTASKDMIVPMQMYFFTKRKNGQWNTYHASNVLMTVLPDLLAEGATDKQPASIMLEGKVNKVIYEFPYRMTLDAGEELRLRKEKGVPVYFMQYVRERVIKAKTGVEGFAIKTSFENGQYLEAGKPEVLTVEVEVKKDASFEYVMIEVPVPGACSYADKTQRHNRVETHREYFRDRTAIFCENMTAGRYFFQVHLLPRFTGTYLVNPAQVSLMYVPVVNANTDLKKVNVK